MTDVVLAQLSDLHVGLAPGHALWGRDPSAMLATVCAEVRDLAPDLVMLSGDLTDVGDIASTQYVADVTRDLAPQVRWLAGNHDHPASLHAVEPTWVQPAISGAWTLVPLESWVEGEWFGRLSAGELARLEALLGDLSTPYAVLAVHQPVQGVCAAPGCVLETAAELKALIARFPAVRVVISGHQHHPFEHLIDGVVYAGAGSTCTQVEHVGDGFEPMATGPMFTILRLGSDGTVSVKHHECEGILQ